MASQLWKRNFESPVCNLRVGAHRTSGPHRLVLMHPAESHPLPKVTAVEVDKTQRPLRRTAGRPGRWRIT